VQAKTVWSVPETYPLVGPGTLVTAGGVVFYGTSDNKFKALDAKTGALLWSTTLECPVVSNPITYTGPDGKQRVAVYSGTNSCPVSTIPNDAKVTPGKKAAPPAAIPPGGPEMQALYRSVPPLAQSTAPATVKSGYLHVFKLP
jgi:alcohol dehydrogenase (cytochrome c)